MCGSDRCLGVGYRFATRNNSHDVVRQMASTRDDRGAGRTKR